MNIKRLLAMGSAALAATVLAIQAQPTQAQGPHELNIGSLAPKGTPWYMLLEKIEGFLEEKSNGQINVIIRPPGMMAEVEMVRETRRGERLQAAAVTTAALAEGGNIPQMQLLELPYLFNNNTEADYVLDNVLFDPMGETLRKRGFVLTVWSENGWRSFGTKNEPVKTPADLAKFKMRAQESDVHMRMYQAYGANAVQKPMTEVLTSLQSNVIDGLDNTALYIAAGGLAEPLDYFTLSKHIYQPALVVVSKRFFDGLPEDLQKLVLETKQFTQEGRDAIREEDANMLEVLKSMNVEVVELTPEEREAFATTARGIHDSFAAEIDGGPELLKKIRDGVKAAK